MQLHLQSGRISYFKSEPKPEVLYTLEPQGTVALNNVEWCRTTDSSADCMQFEFISGARVYRFMAEDSDTCKKWIQLINQGIKQAKNLDKTKDEARIKLNSPPRILRHDGYKTEAERAEAATEAVDMLFMSCDGENIDVLMQASIFSMQGIQYTRTHTHGEYL